jgi:hypothetical protein
MQQQIIALIALGYNIRLEILFLEVLDLKFLL